MRIVCDYTNIDFIFIANKITELSLSVARLSLIEFAFESITFMKQRFIFFPHARKQKRCNFESYRI